MTILFFMILFLIVMGLILWNLVLTIQFNQLKKRWERENQNGSKVQDPTPSFASPPAVEPVRDDPFSKRIHPTEEQSMASPPSAPSEPKPTEGADADSGVIREGWEWFVGGRVLNRIGAFALFLGVVFFLKYAFDHNWIHESNQVLLGGALGFLLIGYGIRTRRQGYRVFSQGVVGGGIAILYGSVYAAHQFYQLVPFVPALLLMAGVTALGMFLALRHHSLAVALLAWAGGFTTPFLLHSEAASPMGLLLYTGVFALGMTGVFLRREKWFILHLFTLVGTYVMWGLAFFAAEEGNGLAVFLLAYWLLFFGVDVRMVAAGGSRSALLPGVSALHAGIAAVALVGLTERFWEDSSGLALMGLGLVYYLTASRFGVRTDRVIPVYESVAVLFMAWGLALQFPLSWTLVLWSLLAAGAVHRGRTQEKMHWWVAGHAVTLLAVLTWIGAGLVGAWELSDAWPLFHERSLATLALAGSLVWGAYQSRGSKGLPGQSVLAGILHAAWGMLLFIWGTMELFQWFEVRSTGEEAFWLPFAWATWWMVYGWVLLQLKGEKGHPVLMGIAVCSAILAILTGAVWMLVPYQPIQEFMLLLNGRTPYMLILLGGIAGWAWTLKKKEASWAYELRRLLPGIAVFFLFLGLSAETRDLFGLLMDQARQSGAGTPDLEALLNGERLTLSIVWLVYSVLLMTVGIIRRLGSMRWMAMVLFGITIIKIFVWDLSFLESVYRIVSFMGLGVILLGVSFAYQKYRHRLQTSMDQEKG
ncbi:DUF2339 domain-containing protein [Desmospora profundinema]|uniref:Membrane protein n=1 Tax=Desmospora profundinema TaxID=1571184 RepID=A0ABU1IKD6_9BACL|nr:DUF2339 domain-containing protein [Desmospora profundinema]MDR6225240.1 putative membrane protein [Desmospora profundinema]